MTAISTDQVRELRALTGVSVMQCKKALEEAHGDMEKARTLLKEAGAAIAEKKAGRDLGAGTVASYVHGEGAIGALLELLCETDFVAKNEEFRARAYDLAMQVAATDADILDAGTDEFLKQPFIKNPSETVADVVQGITQKFGERTEIGRFVKFSI